MTNTWCLVLAAGQSLRFGGVKAKAKWNSGTLLSHSLNLANSMVGSKLCVVLGAHAEVLKPDLQDFKFTENPNWEKGMGASLSWGVQHILRLDSNVTSILILPVDQPLITKLHLEDLLEVSLLTEKCVLTESATRGFGPPAVLTKSYFAKALELNSNRGLKSVLTPQDYTTVENEFALMDADTPQELGKLQEENYEN